MISWKEVVSNFQNDFAWSGRDTSRPRQIIDIQYDTTIMGGREVSRPYQHKKHRFHPLKQDKIGTIIFQFHFTDP